MKKREKLILIFFIIPIYLLPLYLSGNNNDHIFNPFKKNSGSMLDFNRFNMTHQISFFSISGKNYSRSFGTYLSTTQYGINNNWTAFLHLGKKMNLFSKKNDFKLDEKNDYLRGGSLIYRTRSNLTLGIEYGAAPNDFNFIHSPFSFNSFTSLPHTLNIDHNNTLKLWLNKNFRKSKINVHIQYQQMKFQNPEEN